MQYILFLHLKHVQNILHEMNIQECMDMYTWIQI